MTLPYLYSINMKNRVYDIIHYEYVKPSLKRPLLYSVLLHVVLGVYLSLNTPDIMNTSVTLSMIFQENRILEEMVSDTEIPENLENKETQNENRIEEPSDIPGMGFNDSQYNTADSTIYQDYDPGARSKDTTHQHDTQTQNHETSTNKEWSDEKTDKINTEKTSTSDKVKEPGKARVNSQKTEWVKGVNRVLLYQPTIEFPEMFRDRGMEYEVKLKISVNAEGHVISSDIDTTCGETRLDILARNGMMDARYKKKESSMRNGDVDVAYVTILFAFPK